jgi:hypothetical protein
MNHLDPTALLWMFGLVQAAGITSAWLARLSEGSRAQRYCQALFVVSLLLTGVATMVAPQFGGNYWLLSAATLGVMVLFAVCDFRQTEPFTSHIA